MTNYIYMWLSLLMYIMFGASLYVLFMEKPLNKKGEGKHELYKKEESKTGAENC